MGHIWSLYKCEICEHEFKVKFEITAFSEDEASCCPVCSHEEITFMSDDIAKGS
jgi:DNA-directed RNA polymerase subunit RPC12/RpoP